MRNALIWGSYIGIVAILLSGCGKDSGGQTSAANQAAVASAPPAPVVASAPESVAPPPPPPHSYSMVDNGTYGYEPALSEEDVRNGTATKPLIMMRYVGNQNGTYVIIILGQDANNANVVSRVSCQAPCEFAKSETLAGDTVVKTETLRVTPNSLVGAMLTDATSGQLAPYGHTTPSQGLLPQHPPMTAGPAQANVATTTPVSDGSTSAPQQPQVNDAALQQTSFDCNQAGSIPQYLICHDPDLAASDRSLADLVQKARVAAQDQAAFSDRLRKQWNYREKNCKDKACLTSWYSYESEVMTKIAQTGDANVK